MAFQHLEAHLEELLVARNESEPSSRLSCAALTPLPGMLDKWDGTGSLAARTSVFSGRQKIERVETDRSIKA